MRQRSVAAPMALAIVALCVALGPAATAHHSYADFDMKTTRTVKGTVDDWAWTNPHSFLSVVVAGPQGAQERWSFEAPSPALLARVGFSRSLFRKGQQVEVTYHPSRDKPAAGALDTVALESGENWSTSRGLLTAAKP